MGLWLASTCNAWSGFDSEDHPVGPLDCRPATIEIESKLLRVMAVVKLRASAHSDELRLHHKTATFTFCIFLPIAKDG